MASQTHNMHAHSMEAYRTTNFGARMQAVLAVYMASNAPLSDKEVMERLGFADANAVRPRVTELCIGGFLWECGKTKDPVTGRTVRVCTTTSLARGI